MSELEEVVHYTTDEEDFYILGLPVETRLGYCHFLKVKDYPRYNRDLQLVSWTKLHFINQFKQSGENEDVVERFEQLSLLGIVFSIPEVVEAYENVFRYFFNIDNDEMFYGLENEEEFEYIRGLILKLACIKEEKINPNPEIQKAIERSKRVKSQNSEKMTFSDMVSSVSVIKGVSYDEILDMTLYQLYMDYYRIAQDKSYQTTTLFATVPTDKPQDIESWSKNINLFEEEKHGISQSKFNKTVRKTVE